MIIVSNDGDFDDPVKGGAAHLASKVFPIASLLDCCAVASACHVFDKSSKALENSLSSDRWTFTKRCPKLQTLRMH